MCLLCAHAPGREWSDWSSELRIPGDELKWKFTSDGSVNGWGWRFTVYPIMPAAGEPLNSLTQSHQSHPLQHTHRCRAAAVPPGPKDLLSDRCILSCPSMDLVTCLLDFRLNFASNRSIVPRLAASLAACAQLSALGRKQLFMWLCSCYPNIPCSRRWCDLFLCVCVHVLLTAAAGHRMWALQRLRKLLTTEYGQSININRLLGDSEGEARSMVS